MDIDLIGMAGYFLAIVFVNLLLMSDVGFVPQVHGPELSVSMVNEFD